MKLSKLSIFLTILTILIVIGLNNLLYFPGSDSLYRISHYLYSAFNMLFIVLVFISLIWLILNLLLKWSKKLPALILVISILLLFISPYISDYFRNSARERTIDEASQLISAIDRFHAESGNYPDKLSFLIPDYINEIPSPSTIGIPRYHYAKKDSTFELKFYQNVIMSFNYEVVIYNPLGEHKGEGEMPQLYPTSKELWKYYIFD